MIIQRIVSVGLALAVVLTGATQLRLPGLPIGPGEVLLAGWILFVGLLLLRGTVTLSRLFRALVLYWLLAFVLLGFGAMMGAVTGLQHRESAGHDGLAFVLAAVVTCFTVLRWNYEGVESFQLRLARHIFFLCSAATTVLLIVAQSRLTLGTLILWYGGIRFRGWALNPNQMALFAVTMPFLGWYLMQHTHGPFRKASYLAGIGAAVAVGMATQSDALRVAWVGGLGAAGGLLWLHSIARGRGRYLFVSYLLVPFAVIYFGAVLGDDLAREVNERFQRMYGEYDQGEARLGQWQRGIDVIQQSPVVGIGPGRPRGGLLQDGEAHNSLIDWGMATGILGIVLHAGLLAWCAVRAMQAGSPPLVGIIIALIGFCMLHYTLRQPIYWLVLVLVLSLSERWLAVGVAQAKQIEALHAPPIEVLRGKT
jgi:O-antigen ligase